MVAPPDPEEDSGTDECANCGAEIDTSEWYPVATVGDDHRIVAFCERSCREEWLEERREG